MSGGSAVVPSTQLSLELDGGWSSPVISDSPEPHDHGYAYPDLLSTDSPGADHCGSDDDEDPPAHSCTPSLAVLLNGTTSTSSQHHDERAAAPEQQVTWSQLRGPGLDPSKPVEAQLTGLELAGRFRIGSILGHGSFGFTYRALDTSTGAEVAVKIASGHAESHNPARPSPAYQYDRFLQVEWQAYHRLMTAEGAAPAMGFPCMLAAGVHHWCPHDPDNNDQPVYTVSFLALELVGPSLWDACKRMKHDAEVFEDYITSGCSSSEEEDRSPARVPSSSWVIKTGKGMLQALASVHNRGYIHRDVKTENFCLDSTGSNDKVFALDFGFARAAYGYYSFNPFGGCSYQDRCASFWGTPNYSSLSSLMSFPQTPRDDLEALVYCLLEMESPDLRLPWNNTLTTNAEAKDGWSMAKLERMSKAKRAAWDKMRRQGAVPAYLVGYFDYITQLTAQDVPDYAWLLMQLDSGATGQPPSRPPHRRVLADWPHTMHSRVEYARYAMAKVADAAAKILPSRRSSSTSMAAAAEPSPRPQQQRSSKRPVAETQQPEEQGPHKRMRHLLWLDGGESEAFSDAESDEEEPLSASQGAADAAGEVGVSAAGSGDGLQRCSPGNVDSRSTMLKPAWAVPADPAARRGGVMSEGVAGRVTLCVLGGGQVAAGRDE